MRWFLARLREPSTYAGIGVLAQTGQQIASAPGGFNTVNIVGAIVGLVAIFAKG
jgi:hypothetical protein